MERYMADIVRAFTLEKDDVLVGARQISRDWAEMLPGGVERISPLSKLIPRTFSGLWFSGKGAAWCRRQRTRGRCVIALTRVSDADVVITGGTHRGYLKHMGKRGWSLRDRLENLIEQRAYETAKHIVAHSRLLKREIVELYGIPEEKVSVIYPPIDQKRFQSSLKGWQAEFRAKFGLGDSGRRYILFPSGGHLRKGLPLLMEAVALLPRGKYEIVIAGRKPDFPTPDFVRSIGRVEEMEKLYAACDLTVMPSLYEPFGLVYVESVLSGTPVVLPADSAGASEVLSDSAVRLHEYTPRALAGAIESALERKDCSLNGEIYDPDIKAHVGQIKRLLAGLRLPIASDRV